MNYQSTKNRNCMVKPSETILRGISEEGGLFVPESVPFLEQSEIKNLCSMEYCQKANYILQKFLTDFSEEEISNCTQKAYIGHFEKDIPAPITKMGNNTYILELWHGPTCAFKDMALQILPHFLVTAEKKSDKKQKAVILTATSGDTGKAALDGFCDVDGTKIIVFYPENGVSKIQKLQMQTQEGDNISVFGIRGNFDDTQTAVKRIFTNEAIRKQLAEKGLHFSSANSINVGRLLPQIIYYISAYTDLLANGEIEEKEGINISVPTGNFGNILAAYYARKMGIPIKKLICASNANRVLTDFFESGIYDRNREFYMTESPSMDILISSNLERLLFDLSDKDDALIQKWMASLQKEGKYQVPSNIKEKMDALFYAGYCTDEETEEMIHYLFEKYSYLCDPHTAVAIKVYDDYRKNTGDTAKTIIASTASPYKFPSTVLKAIKGFSTDDEFAAAKKLEQCSNLKMPQSLRDLMKKEVRFSGSFSKEEIENLVKDCIGGEN